MKPRVLFVSRTRYAFPLDETLARRFDALDRELDWHVFAAARRAGDVGAGPRFTLVRPLRPRVFDGPLFYLRLPFRTARALRRFRPEVAVVQGAHETALVLLARRLARVDTRIVLDLHGDWRAATRLYGSRTRTALSPIADAVADYALRAADGIRSITPYTTRLLRARGLEPLAEFPAYMDLGPFTGPTESLPARPQALFVGVLERYKNVDGLISAWRDVRERVRDARLRIIGDGTLRDIVDAERDERTTWDPRLSTGEVVRALDGATLLVLPSRSEGMGRVVVEAFCRGRPVVGSRVGGIPDLVEDRVNGLLVDPGDASALADAIVEVLSDRELAKRLGEAARASAEAWIATPEEWARSVRELVDRVLGLH